MHLSRWILVGAGLALTDCASFDETPPPPPPPSFCPRVDAPVCVDFEATGTTMPPPPFVLEDGVGAPELVPGERPGSARAMRVSVVPDGRGPWIVAPRTGSVAKCSFAVKQTEYAGSAADFVVIAEVRAKNPQGAAVSAVATVLDGRARGIGIATAKDGTSKTIAGRIDFALPRDTWTRFVLELDARTNPIEGRVYVESDSANVEVVQAPFSGANLVQLAFGNLGAGSSVRTTLLFDDIACTVTN